MLRFYASYVLIGISCSHIICCGIPLLLFSINSTFVSLSIFNNDILEIFEIYLFLFATFIFVLILGTEFYLKKIKCCDEIQCKKKKETFKTNLLIATLLYLVNFSVFAIELIFE